MNSIDSPSNDKLPRGLLLVPLLGALTVIAILTAMMGPMIIGGPEPEPKVNLGTAPTTDWTAAMSAKQRASEVVTNANAASQQVDLALEALKK